MFLWLSLTSTDMHFLKAIRVFSGAPNNCVNGMFVVPHK